MEELTHKGWLKLDPQGSYFHPEKSHSKNIQGKLILKIYMYCFLHCTSILTNSFRTFVEKRYSFLMFVCFHLYWNSTVPVSKNVKIVSIQTLGSQWICGPWSNLYGANVKYFVSVKLLYASYLSRSKQHRCIFLCIW